MEDRLVSGIEALSGLEPERNRNAGCVRFRLVGSGTVGFVTVGED